MKQLTMIIKKRSSTPLERIELILRNLRTKHLFYPETEIPQARQAALFEEIMGKHDNLYIETHCEMFFLRLEYLIMTGKMSDWEIETFIHGQEI